MKDNETTIAEIKKVMKEFVIERDWRQFHTPKDLAIAIAGEAGELLEHFRFRNGETLKEYLKNQENMLEVRREMADVASFLIRLADELDVDLADAINEKIEHNRKRFPIETASGSGWMDIKKKEKLLK